MLFTIAAENPSVLPLSRNGYIQQIPTSTAVRGDKGGLNLSSNSECLNFTMQCL